MFTVYNYWSRFKPSFDSSCSHFMSAVYSSCSCSLDLFTIHVHCQHFQLLFTGLFTIHVVAYGSFLLMFTWHNLCPLFIIPVPTYNTLLFMFTVYISCSCSRSLDLFKIYAHCLQFLFVFTKLTVHNSRPLFIIPVPIHRTLLFMFSVYIFCSCSRSLDLFTDHKIVGRCCLCSLDFFTIQVLSPRFEKGTEFAYVTRY
jgi:hypothetical protein